MAEHAETTVFTDSEIDKILGFTGMELRDKLRTELKSKVDTQIEEYFSKELLFNLDVLKQAKMPQVVLRIRTVHMILDEIRGLARDSAQFEDSLRSVGYRVGMSFGIDFVGFLEAIVRRLPVNIDTLLKTWAKFDSAADFGTIEILESRVKKVSILLRDSFLLARNEKNQHRNCSFFEGYIRGVFSHVIPEWSSIMLRDHKIPLPKYPRIGDVNETGKTERTCGFTVELAPEFLPQTKSATIEAVSNFRKADFDESLAKSRIALEYALKERLRLPVEGTLKFKPCLEVCAKYLPKFDPKDWANVYDEVSQPHHVLTKISENQALSTLIKTRSLIDSFEALALTHKEIGVAQESMSTNKFYDYKV